MYSSVDSSTWNRSSVNMAPNRSSPSGFASVGTGSPCFDFFLPRFRGLSSSGGDSSLCASSALTEGSASALLILDSCFSASFFATFCFL